MKVVAVRDDNVITPHCGICVHAAFDDGGVYCKEFHESILDERVAKDCGAYEPNGIVEAPNPAVQAKRSTEMVQHDWDAHPEAQEAGFAPSDEELRLAIFHVQPDMTGLVARFEDYLTEMHCQLWGQQFNIWAEEGRHKAALWLAEVFTEALNGEGNDAEGT